MTSVPARSAAWLANCLVFAAEKMALRVWLREHYDFLILASACTYVGTCLNAALAGLPEFRAMRASAHERAASAPLRDPAPGLMNEWRLDLADGIMPPADLRDFIEEPVKTRGHMGTAAESAWVAYRGRRSVVAPAAVLLCPFSRQCRPSVSSRLRRGVGAPRNAEPCAAAWWRRSSGSREHDGATHLHRR
jgi:hypothetical protein